MVRIRLRRMGKNKQPSYRVVVADSRAPRDGRFIEIIGHYNPIRQPKVLDIKTDRARYWLSVGAQPSDTVSHLLKQVHVLDEAGRVLPPSETETPAPAPTPVAPVATATPDAPIAPAADTGTTAEAVATDEMEDSDVVSASPTA